MKNNLILFLDFKILIAMSQIIAGFVMDGRKLNLLYLMGVVNLFGENLPFYTLILKTLDQHIWIEILKIHQDMF